MAGAGGGPSAGIKAVVAATVFLEGAQHLGGRSSWAAHNQEMSTESKPDKNEPRCPAALPPGLPGRWRRGRTLCRGK